MRRIFPLLLCALIATPLHARADEEKEEEAPKPKSKKKKSKGEEKKPKGEMRFDDLDSLTPKAEKAEAPEVVEEKKPEPPSAPFKRRRYAYFLGGGFIGVGLAFAFSASGEARRAETILSAREASQALDNARASAATATVAYGFAAATLVAALLFEFLPEPIAEKASLTFHF